MRTFFNNYYTKYSCRLNNKPIQVSHTACFAALFNDLKLCYDQDKLQPLYLDINIELLTLNLDKERDNCVVLNKKELHYYLNYLKRLHKFQYVLTKLGTRYNLNIKCNLTPIHIKHLLTCIRYVYESSYNVLLADSIQIFQTKPIAKKANLLEIFYALMNFSDYNSGHMPRDIYKAVYVINYKYLKSELNKNWYMHYSFDNYKQLDTVSKLNDDICYEIIHDKYYWDKNQFETRFKQYKLVLKELLKYKRNPNEN